MLLLPPTTPSTSHIVLLLRLVEVGVLPSGFKFFFLVLFAPPTPSQTNSDQPRWAGVAERALGSMGRGRASLYARKLQSEVNYGFRVLFISRSFHLKSRGRPTVAGHYGFCVLLLSEGTTECLLPGIHPALIISGFKERIDRSNSSKIKRTMNSSCNPKALI